MRKLALCLCILLGAASLGCGGTTPDDETTPEIVRPEQSVNFSFWDWQVGTAGDAEGIAKKAKKMGFTGVDFTFRWTSLEYTRGEYEFRYIDAILDEIAKQDLFISTSLMFWSINLPWKDQIEWQKLENGTVYEFSGRGASPSFSDEKTVKAMTDAYAAFTEHVYDRYGKRVIRMHARASQYGELEYFCDAGGMLDYGEPAVEGFRSYLKRERPTPADLTKASGNTRTFSSSAELDRMSGTELSETFYFDWQNFRQNECLKLADALRGVQRKTAPDVPFAIQVGSIWDAAAVKNRGVFDPWLASQACDILHTDDGPGFPHDFSMDYVDVNPDVALASEIDGLWHPAIQALVQKGDKSLSPYVKQAEHMGRKKIAYLNTANWSGSEMEEFSEALSNYPRVFLNAEPRGARAEEIAILINTPDLLYKQKAATELYLSVFNRLSEDGAKQVRFVTDTQLLAHPELLAKIGTLYLGNTAGELCLREEVAALFKSSKVELLTEEAPTSVSVKNEFRLALGTDQIPTLTKA